jgi:hypothetical protein
VVALPPVALVNVVDFYGNFEDQEKASDAITSKVEPQLLAIVQENGGRVASPADLEACGALCGRLMMWGVVASLEIGAQRAEIRNYGRHSVADWAFRGDLSTLRRTFDADYVLLTVFKQTRQTDGHKLGMALAGGYTVGKQIDVACMADLRSGHMAWCATKKDDSSDLGENGRPCLILAELLGGVFRTPTGLCPGVPSEPGSSSP